MLRRLSALFVALALVVTGCSGDDDGGGGDGKGAATTDPVRGGVLRVGVQRPRTLDPAEALPSSQAELLVADLMFDGLTSIDPETGRAAPLLAAKVATKDRKTWQFRLRKDRRFANGRVITAKDAEYSIERVAKKGARSPAAAQLELIVGYRDFIDGKTKDLAGVELGKRDKDILTVTLRTPFATLPELLASPLFGLVPKEAVTRPNPAFKSAPVGSGPFVLDEREGNVVHLVRAKGVEAYLDAIDLEFFDDAERAYEAFAQGELDWSQVDNSRVEEAAETYGRDGFQSFQATLFYGFNLKHPSFKSRTFREAIVHAIDREALVRAVYNDTVAPMDGVVIDGVAGASENACGARCEYDPDKAKAQLKELFGKKKPPTIAIDYDSSTTQEAIAKTMAASLKKVGIAAKLRGKPFADYQEFVGTGKQQMFRLGWISVYPSADAFLLPLFLTGVPDNVTGFSIKAIDEILRSARAAADPEKRAELYAKAEAAIMARVPVVPIAQFQTHSVSAPRVHDLDVTVGGTFDPTRVWVTGG